LRRRAKNIIDQWDGKHYTRVFVIDEQLVKVMIEQKNDRDIPQLLVSTHKHITQKIQIKLSKILEMMLGLKQNVQAFYQLTAHDKYLKPLVIQFMGVKPPRFPSLFEALVNSISCQQISLDAGLQIQNRLAQHSGKCLHEGNDSFYAFPMPKDIADCSVSALKKIGYSKQKSETLVRIALAMLENENLLDELESKMNEEIVQILCQFKGIGRWSAEYVLLRGLDKIETFPGDDVGAQKNLQELLHLGKKLDYQKISKITKKWYPYAGFIYFHLLLYKLDKKNLL
jgi:DNA-3-methyladenine glycosylase II